MSIWPWTIGGRLGPAMRLALGALAVTAGFTVWTLARILRDGDPPTAPPITLASLETIARPASSPPADIHSAVENDLFSPDRSAPAASYRMPGESDSSAKPVTVAERPTLLGTVVATDGRNFATVQLSDGRPVLVHVGDKVGDWVVKAIDRGKIVLASGGTRIEVTYAGAPISSSNSTMMRSPSAVQDDAQAPGSSPDKVCPPAQARKLKC